jgi:LysM repeat protein
MLGIAIRYGVTLEALKAANPEVDPRLMSIGQVLIVPIVNQPEEIQPSPTAVAVRLENPVCYSAADGSLVCLTEVVNDNPQAIENLSAWFGLYTQEGEAVDGQMVFPPLNLIPSGSRMPLLATFPPPLPFDPTTARADVMTALSANEPERRYIAVQELNYEDRIAEDSKSAFVQGQVVLAAPAEQFSGAAVAYDAQGQLAGVREWKTKTGCPIATPEPTESVATVTPTAPVPCGPVPFEITVYSLGPLITEVEILIEAKP